MLAPTPQPLGDPNASVRIMVGDGGGGEGDGESDPLQDPKSAMTDAPSRRRVRLLGLESTIGTSSSPSQGETSGGDIIAPGHRLRLLADGNDTLHGPRSGWARASRRPTHNLVPVSAPGPLPLALTTNTSLDGGIRRNVTWRRSAALVQTDMEQENRQSRKLAWFHVPKCSTSIGTTFAHYIKPDLPDGASMPACTGNDPCLYSPFPEIEFAKRHGFAGHMVGLWNKNGNWGDHKGIDQEAWENFKGNFVGLFRDPLRRAISAYKWFGQPVNASPSEYARRIQGTTVRMMAGQRYGLDCNWPKFPCDSNEWQEPANLKLALERLEGFKFVGLTDEYPLSVCLFHAKFGGECLPSEFENMRPTSAKSTRRPNPELSSELLGDVVDEEETVLFMAVYDMFCSDMRTHGVTQRECKRTICPRAAQHFEDSERSAKTCDLGREAFETFLRGGYRFDESVFSDEMH